MWAFFFPLTIIVVSQTRLHILYVGGGEGFLKRSHYFLSAVGVSIQAVFRPLEWIIYVYLYYTGRLSIFIRLYVNVSQVTCINNLFKYLLKIKFKWRSCGTNLIYMTEELIAVVKCIKAIVLNGRDAFWGKYCCVTFKTIDDFQKSTLRIFTYIRISVCVKI